MVKDTLHVTECTQLCENEFDEAIWCIINVSNQEKLLVGLCYRSLSSSHENNNKLNEMLKGMKDVNYNRLLLMGDFNFGDINWENGECESASSSESALFLETTLDLFLHQNVIGPTRFREGQKPSRLDLVSTEDENSIDDITSHAPLGKSDHSVLTWTYQITNADQSQKVCSDKLNFHRGNYEAMNRSLAMVDWSILNNMEVDEMWTFIRDKLHDLIRSHVLKHQSRSVRLDPPWWNRKLTRQVKRKMQAWNNYRALSTEDNLSIYRRQRNKTTTMIRDARHKFESTIVNCVKRDPKRLYRYIRTQQKVKDVIPPLMKAGGFTETEGEAAEELQKFFRSVFVDEGDCSGPAISDEVAPEDVISDINITLNEVKEELEHLNTFKAAGPDCIPSIVLRKCATHLSFPLMKLFRCSLQSGTLPQDWKNAVIIPIYKKGQRSAPNNYRPVSLTSQVCKVMERIIKKRIVSHLDAHNLVSKHQHGFVAGRSCQSNLLVT